MFTGIVQAVGTVEVVAPRQGGVRLTLDAGVLDTAGIALGDSICVQGCCLTVVAHAGRKLGFDVSRETLGCTAGLAHPGEVNLEKSLALGDKLGGHLVTGHVDGVGEVLAFVAADEFEVNLIPHTLEVTTLGRLAPGVRVNLELDLLARYVERMLAAS